MRAGGGALLVAEPFPGSLLLPSESSISNLQYSIYNTAKQNNHMPSIWGWFDLFDLFSNLFIRSFDVFINLFCIFLKDHQREPI